MILGISSLYRTSVRCSLQLRVLSLGCDENGNVGVGVFPERAEILVGCLGFGGVAPHGIGTCETKMRQCSEGTIQDDAWMVKKFLKLTRGLRTLMQRQVRFAAHVGGIHSPSLKG